MGSRLGQILVGVCVGFMIEKNSNFSRFSLDCDGTYVLWLIQNQAGLGMVLGTKTVDLVDSFCN